MPRSCPSCGNPLPEGAMFCTKCGAIMKMKINVADYKTKSQRSRPYEEDRQEIEKRDMEQMATPATIKARRMKKCPECWHNISTEATFCTYCGTQFDEELIEQKTPPKAPRKPTVKAEQAKKKKNLAQQKGAQAKKPVARPAAGKAAPPQVKKQTIGVPPKKVPSPIPQKAPTEPKTEPVAAKTIPKPISTPAKPTELSEAAKSLQIDMLEVPGDVYPQPKSRNKTLQVKKFALARHPITCAQYKVFCDDTEHPVPSDWIDGSPLPEKENHPVILVTLNDAIAFCCWCGKRLPTPTEWAVAFGSKNAHKFPWGDQANEVKANCDEHAEKTTVSVASIEGDAGPFGHRDLVGNVRQWLFEPDPTAESQPDGNSPQGKNYLAGASYADPAWLAEYGRADSFPDPAFSSFFIGFRCAADIE